MGEEKMKAEEAERKAKEAEEKKKRLEEAEAKRQEMLEAQKAQKADAAEKKKSVAAGPGDAQRKELSKTKEQLEEEKKKRSMMRKRNKSSILSSSSINISSPCTTHSPLLLTGLIFHQNNFQPKFVLSFYIHIHLNFWLCIFSRATLELCL